MAMQSLAFSLTLYSNRMPLLLALHITECITLTSYSIHNTCILTGEKPKLLQVSILQMPYMHLIIFHSNLKIYFNKNFYLSNLTRIWKGCSDLPVYANNNSMISFIRFQGELFLGFHFLSLHFLHLSSKNCSWLSRRINTVCLNRNKKSSASEN
jgi:hypothetical protein